MQAYHCHAVSSQLAEKLYEHGIVQ
jgi:hypothetical protein